MILLLLGVKSMELMGDENERADGKDLERRERMNVRM